MVGIQGLLACLYLESPLRVGCNVADGLADDVEGPAVESLGLHHPEEQVPQPAEQQELVLPYSDQVVLCQEQQDQVLHVLALRHNPLCLSLHDHLSLQFVQ